MTSQSSSWLDTLLDRYQEEKHALPQDAEQFLAFVRKRCGSLAYTAVKQLLAHKADRATQHDVSGKDSPLQSRTVASRSPYDFNAVSLAASSSDSVYSIQIKDHNDGDQSVVPNIEDRLKCDRKPMPSETDDLEAAQGQRNEELQQENKELRVAIKESMQENSQLQQEIQKLRVRQKSRLKVYRQESIQLEHEIEESRARQELQEMEIKVHRQENSQLQLEIRELRARQEMQEMEIKVHRQENSQLQQEIQELRVRQAVVPGMLSPAERETARWLQEELPRWVHESTWEQRREPVAVPVFAVRFTHAFVNASLAFGDQGNVQENILKLYEQMFRDRVKISEIPPLVVKLPEACGGDLGIRSRNNGRLLALRMLQSSRLDECLKVPCHLHTHQDYTRNSKFRAWFDRGDDKTSGWSIRSREGKSKHRGVAIFNNADAAVKGLENLLQRASKTDLPNKLGISHVEAVLKLIKRRPVAPGGGDDDEETLTFASVEDHGS